MTDRERLARLDRAHLIHPLTYLREHAEAGPRIIVEAEGTRLRDDQGREILDGFSGLWCVVAGHGRRKIIEAVETQLSRLDYHTSFYGFSNPPAIELAARLTGLFPEDFGLTRVIFTCGGSEANETLIKMARLYFALQERPEKNKIVARHYSYHGLTMGALSATGIFPFHWMYEPLTPGFFHVPAPYCYQCELDLEYPSCEMACAGALEEAISDEGPDTVAAFIAEPVIGSGGIIAPPPEYFPLVREICDRHEVLLILDEVITGFGRTGEMFACKHWNVRPDMVTLAKGITSGYLPLGAAVMAETIHEVIKEKLPEDLPFMHGFTYMNHPTCCAAGLATLALVEEEGLVEKARENGRYLLERLESLKSLASVGDVRGIGLMAAVELVADRETKVSIEPPHAAPMMVCEKAYELGLYLRPMVEVLGLAPPLVIERSELDRIVDILGESIAYMERKLL